MGRGDDTTAEGADGSGMGTNIAQGCRIEDITVKVIGAIEAEQTERDGKTDRNDRLIGVATHAHTHDHVESLSDLRPQMIEEIEAFFEHYNRLAGKAFKPVKRSDAEAAMVLVHESMGALDEG